MALEDSSLKKRIENNLKAGGIKIEGEHAMVSILTQAVALAVVEEIKEKAEVRILSGSSAGTYKVS